MLCADTAQAFCKNKHPLNTCMLAGLRASRLPGQRAASLAACSSQCGRRRAAAPARTASACVDSAQARAALALPQARRRRPAAAADCSAATCQQPRTCHSAFVGGKGIKHAGAPSSRGPARTVEHAGRYVPPQRTSPPPHTHTTFNNKHSRDIGSGRAFSALPRASCALLCCARDCRQTPGGLSAPCN
eukprot:351342-Chlamydomonas_euryale.AAC.2